MGCSEELLPTLLRAVPSLSPQPQEAGQQGGELLRQGHRLCGGSISGTVSGGKEAPLSQE